MALVNTSCRIKFQMDPFSEDRERWERPLNHIGQNKFRWRDHNWKVHRGGMTIIPSLHPSPISFPDCLPSLYFCNAAKKDSAFIAKLKIGQGIIIRIKETWRWLFKWNRVKPLTFMVRMIAFGVASADNIQNLVRKWYWW